MFSFIPAIILLSTCISFENTTLPAVIPISPPDPLSVKYCMESISILVVTSIVFPITTLLLAPPIVISLLVTSVNISLFSLLPPNKLPLISRCPPVTTVLVYPPIVILFVDISVKIFLALLFPADIWWKTSIFLTVVLLVILPISILFVETSKKTCLRLSEPAIILLSNLASPTTCKTLLGSSVEIPIYFVVYILSFFSNQTFIGISSS